MDREKKDEDVFEKFRQDTYTKMLESESETFNSKLESFSLFMTRKKAEMNKAWEAYHSSLVNGYKAIINKLKSKS